MESLAQETRSPHRERDTLLSTTACYFKKGKSAFVRSPLLAVKDRKSGKKPSLVALNKFLEDAPSHAVLKTDDAMSIRVTRVYGKKTVEAFLAPIAEAVADLLADGDFNLVRHCEGNACVLRGSMTALRVIVQKMVHVDRLRKPRQSSCVSSKSKPNMITSASS